MIGDQGSIIDGSPGVSSPRIIPEASIPRVRGHYEDFIEAIREGRSAGSNFDYGGPLTKIALPGVMAQRFPGVVLKRYGAAGRLVGHDGANRLVQPPPPRPGWPLE